MLRLVLDKKSYFDRLFILNVCFINGGKLGRFFFFFVFLWLLMIVIKIFSI